MRKKSHERKASKNKLKKVQERKRKKKEQLPYTTAGKNSLQHEIECIEKWKVWRTVLICVLFVTAVDSGAVECDGASLISSALHLPTALVNTL